MEIKQKFERMNTYFKTHPSPRVRITAGMVLVIAGILGPFLPILGIWMVPMGLVLLAVDFPVARRLSHALTSNLHNAKKRLFGKREA